LSNTATTAENRVVIVTGAGGAGCGRSISARFAKGGAVVVVSDIDEAGGHDTVRLIERGGGRATFFRTDVRNESQVRDLVSFAEATFGSVSVLVNNASAPDGGEGIDSWMNSMETDLLGALYATRWTIEAMRRGYDVAKAGMIRMTTRLAYLAERDGIHVNCLAPGWIATAGVRQYWESLTPAERADRNVPSQLLTTDQISEAVVRLADDSSLAGRVLVWSSDDPPGLIEWGDRGYRDVVELS
jgi:NAD(P)-dependent dehydrogenase (short-subunit alcohol dehydrogenase family)